MQASLQVNKTLWGQDDGYARRIRERAKEYLDTFQLTPLKRGAHRKTAAVEGGNDIISILFAYRNASFDENEKDYRKAFTSESVAIYPIN